MFICPLEPNTFVLINYFRVWMPPVIVNVYKCFCSFYWLVTSTDFTAPSLDFNFQEGADTVACINVTIIDDNNLEGDHTFTVNLGGMITPILTGGTGGFGTSMSTTVTIQDPEGMLSIPSKISQQSSGTTLFYNMVG